MVIFLCHRFSWWYLDCEDVNSTNQNAESGTKSKKTSTWKPMNSLKNFRAQKKNFFWDSTDPIQFHMGTVSLIIYHMLIHTIFYHISYKLYYIVSYIKFQRTYASKIGQITKTIFYNRNLVRLHSGTYTNRGRPFLTILNVHLNVHFKRPSLN